MFYFDWGYLEVDSIFLVIPIKTELTLPPTDSPQSKPNTVLFVVGTVVKKSTNSIVCIPIDTTI